MKHWAEYAIEQNIVEMYNVFGIFPNRRFFKKFRKDLFYGKWDMDRFLVRRPQTTRGWGNSKALYFCYNYEEE